ncbi:MAG: T9SS type A sorting domain-containing protein [Chitinophagales bacterium]|nr:T9SS type A sorting domain-containing protein [Chitinophagales bacterium]
MKTILQSLKCIAFMVALFLAVSQLQAQTRTASVSGNWNNVTTWGGASVPTSANDVVINNGINVTVNVAAECASLTMNSGGTIMAVTISGSNSLTVTGAITINSGSGNGDDRTIAVGAGTLTCASVSMATTGGNNRTNFLTISTGTATVSGNLIMNDASSARNQVNITGSGTLNVGGTFTGGGTTFNSGSTVNYSGATQTIRNTTYGNLTISGSGIKTTAADITMTGNLLVESGATLTLGGNDVNINISGNRSAIINGTVNINGNGRLIESGTGTKTLIIGSGGVLNITDNGGSTLPVLNAYNFDANSTVNFGSTDNQTIENSATYGHLTTSGSGTKTLESNGGTMNFLGNITIGNGTTLASSNKTMNVGGNWSNNGTFTQGTSTVVLNGTTTQSIGGANTTTFNSLTINNTSVAGVTLSKDITVTATLTLTDGVVNTSATPNGLLQISSSGSISGGSTDSYVSGPLRRTGSSGFTFTVGKSGIYSPLTISAPGNVGDIFEAEYMRSSGSALGSLGSGLYGVSNCEYWQLNEINNAGSANSISVNVGWGPSSGCGGSGYVTDLTGIVLAHFDGSTWTSLGGSTEGGSTPSVGSITASGVTTFSPFTLGNILPNANPLPVKFSGIKAFEKQSGIQIDWIAYQEDNVDLYQVEHSADGVVFTPIGTVNSRNSSVETNYSFFDASPLPGVNFYRLRNVDFDGKSGYSNIVKVNLDKSVKDISFYPNPVRGEFVSLQSSDLAKGNYSVRVMNSAGQQVYTQRFNHTGGAINQTIHLPVGMQSGIYILQLDRETSKVLSKTFVVQK